MDQPTHQLKPGALWPALLERTEHARRCGAIQSIPTTSELIEQDGVAFQVRLVTALAKKAGVRAASPHRNPFLPYDPDLFVTDLSPTHVALLNKFNVVEHHLLIITRAFEEQETLLTRQDCEALLVGLAEIDGLGFYNAGPVAGASQPHKHLQIIPLTEAPDGRLPIEPLLSTVCATATIGPVPGLPFLHAAAPFNPRWLDRGQDNVISFHACYRALLDVTGLSIEPLQDGLERCGPYNLLVTRRWLLLVPRSEESFEGISINALGFAGALLVKDTTQLAVLKRHGPMTALRHVTRSRLS